MRKLTMPPSGLLVASMLAACVRDDGGRMPAQTQLVGSLGGAPLDPVLSPDGTRLAWAEPVAGQARIHVGGADGSNSVMLSGGTWDYDPRWSPDGRWIAYVGESPEFDLWVVSADGGEPRQLTSGPGFDDPAGWLPDGTGVVFHRLGAGAIQTLVAPVDGGAIRPLIANPGGSQIGMPSPDGSRVAFELRRGSETTIWVQDIAGGQARQLTTEGLEGGSPVRKMWSPDGSRLLFVSRRTGTTDLWTANVETSELKQVTTDVRNDREHSWSPDGRWIAFVSDRGGKTDVWIVSSEGGEAVRVTDDLAIETYVGWYPDGASLYFLREEADGVLGVTVAGGEPRLLVQWPGYQMAQRMTTLSPDGQTLLFVGNRSGNNDIWSVPLAGGEAVPFASSPLEEAQPQHSPDGRQVAFASNRTGSFDVWVMPAGGGEPRRLTDWTSNETSPRWSPDGTQIAFVSDHDATQQDVWLVAAEGGTPRRITTFNRGVVGSPAWSPDGTSLYVYTTGERGGELHRVPVASGRAQPLRMPPTTPLGGGGSLSPDGAWYAYSAVEGGWAFVELSLTDGGPSRRITHRKERVWQPYAIWSPDGSKLSTPDWQFGDATGSNLVELSVNDTTTRLLRSSPGTRHSPELYTPDGRVVFTAQRNDGRLVRVSVAGLLAGR